MNSGPRPSLSPLPRQGQFLASLPEDARAPLGLLKFVAYGDDIIIVTDGVQNYPILKPWILRRTPFDGLTVDGVAYTYTNGIQRSATPTGGSAATEYVTQDWQTNEEISGEGYEGGVYMLVTSVDKALVVTYPPVVQGVWMIDKNRNAHAWAVA